MTEEERLNAERITLIRTNGELHQTVEKLLSVGNPMLLFLYHKNWCNKIKDTYSQCNCGMAEVRDNWCHERDKYDGHS